MSVPTQETVNRHTGNGIAKVFGYEFYLLDMSDMMVTVNSQLLTSGYQVENVGNINGGSVIFNDPPSDGSQIIFERVVKLERTTDYQQNGDFISEVVNKDYDRLWMALQQSEAVTDRALRIPVADAKNINTTLPVAVLRKNKAVVFDATGNVTVSIDDYNDQAKEAKASADAAKASEIASKSSENKAATSEANALSSKQASQASKEAAAQSESKALESRNSARVSELNAADSAAAAALSVESAVKLYGDLDAVHTAVTEAEASATASATSASNAAQSESHALASQTEANLSRESAAQSALAAADSAASISIDEDKMNAAVTSAAISATNAAKSAADAARSAETASAGQVNADWNATSGKAQILNKPELSEVALSGHYDDLEGKPVVGGVPVGTVEYFARETLPQGYLFATGQDVGRDTYPDLFAAIGTTYGEGDGQTTFNLPALNRELGEIVPFASLHMPGEYLMCDGRAISRRDYAELFAVIGTTYGEGDGTSTFKLPDLIDRFTQGSTTPGLKVEAGLPNIIGEIRTNKAALYGSGAFQTSNDGTDNNSGPSGPGGGVTFDASRSNPIYGASDTVQPPALTVCYGIRAKNTLHAAIKAFDATVDQGLVDITELANDIRKAKTPLGTVAWFAMTAPPVGYLIANGAAVGRETYPELFAAIGTTYGEGDGETTFNLPDLIDRFAQGSNTPGQKIEAGLPNIMGQFGRAQFREGTDGGNFTGPFFEAERFNNGFGTSSSWNSPMVGFDASRSNNIYGNSATVQPPALTLLPCIKAFDAAINPGLIDMTGLANDIAGKADRDLTNVYPAQSFKDTCIGWQIPDYTSGISITSGYVAPKAGFICLINLLYNSRASLSINNVEIYSASVTQVWVQLDSTFPVAKGDVITFSNAAINFFPCKGA